MFRVNFGLVLLVLLPSVVWSSSARKTREFKFDSIIENNLTTSERSFLWSDGGNADEMEPIVDIWSSMLQDWTLK